MARARFLSLVLFGFALVASIPPPAVAQEPPWDYTGDLASSPEGRFDHTATLLNDGRVLVAGGTRIAAALATAEVYDPVAGTWAATGALQTGRTRHAAVLLFDGRVLVAGGTRSNGQPTNTAEIYDPAAGTWAATGSLTLPRTDHAMVQLLDGSVLAVGGDGLRTAEVYNPNTGTWQFTNLMTAVRRRATATVLRDGRVLVAGGLDDGGAPLASSEIMNPATYAWAAAAAVGVGRAGHAAALLPDGDVLIVGGTDGAAPLASAVVDDVDGGAWAAASNTLAVGAIDPAALLLADGTVLVAGGGTGRSGRQDAYRYDAAARTFTPSSPMHNGRIGHTLTLLQDGGVLAVGSAQDPEGEDEQTEIYTSTLPAPPGPDPKKPTAGEPCLIRFQLTSMPAGPGCGPYSFSIGEYDFYALLEYFTDAGTGSVATEENLPDVVLNGTNGVTLSFDDFWLSSFRHLPDRIGDRRTYTGGVGEIRVNGDLKIRGVDGSLAVTILYPVPAGPGSAAVSVGYLRIDAANSDPAWVAAFDPNGTGMVRLDFVSFSSTGQICAQGTGCGDCFGEYDVSICLRPLEHRIDARRGLFANDPGADFDFSDVGVVMDFTNADFSALAGAGEARVMAERIGDAPDGALPDGIDRVYEGHYWRFGTTAGAFAADVAFDLTDIPGVDSPANLRLLRREAQDDAWSVYADVQVAGNTLTAQNVDAFSEWALASTGDNALPVELTSFTATLDGADAVLEWHTASETNNAGFDVMRRSNDEHRRSNEETWETVGFIAGRGTTSEAQQYVYRAEGLAAGRHVFRLKQVDYDGTATYSPEVEVFAGPPGAFVLEAAYPNPFNPTTALRFAVDAAMPVRLVVFDVLGRTVTVLYDGIAAPGTVHRVDLDAAHLPSGPYFYRLETPAGTRTRKMLLVK